MGVDTGRAARGYQHNLLKQNFHIQGTRASGLTDPSALGILLHKQMVTSYWFAAFRPPVSVPLRAKQPGIHNISNLHPSLNTVGCSVPLYLPLEDTAFSHDKLKGDVNCNQYRTTSCFHLLGIQNNQREAAAKNPVVAARHHHKASGLPAPSQWVHELLMHFVPSSG